MTMVVAIVAGFLLEASSSAPNQCSSQVGQHVATVTFDEVRAHLPTVAPRGPYESTSEYEGRLAAAQSSAGGPVVIRRGRSRFGLSYNADRHQLAVYDEAFGAGGLDYADIMGRSRIGSTEDNYFGAIGFIVDQVETGRRNFEATNGFGARTTVESIESRIDAVWERPGRSGESQFEGMRAGRPVATLNIGPAEAQDIIERGGTGLLVVPRAPYIRTGTSVREATFNLPRERISAVTVLVADIQCGFVFDGQGRVVLALPVR